MKQESLKESSLKALLLRLLRVHSIITFGGFMKMRREGKGSCQWERSFTYRLICKISGRLLSQIYFSQHVRPENLSNLPKSLVIK